MVELSNATVDKSCKMARIHFPSSLILDVFKDITGDQDLTNFPSVRGFEEDLQRARKAGAKISLTAVGEMSSYFYEEQEGFLLFAKSLTYQAFQHELVNKVTLDAFISKVNALLLEDSRIKIENYGIIQKWVPTRAEKRVFLNINVPEYIQDYFTEALDCLAYDLYRSSILFCIIALEASLRYKYAELVSENKAYAVRFKDLTDWGIKRGFVEQDNFNKINIDFMRGYRNDLAHCNIDKPDAKSRIGKNYAQRMSPIVVRLVEFFINNIFY